MSNLSVVSIGIAGWGEASTGLPYRIRIAHTGDAGGTVVAAPILNGHPSELSTRLDLAESWVESGSLSFKASRIDEHAAAIALRRYLFASNPRPIGYISADATAAASSITFVGSPESYSPSVGDILYIGREVMKVLGVAGSIVAVDRGMFGTEAQAHSSDPLTGDRWVYDRNPIVETREVVRYDYNPATDAETERWSGILEPPTLDNGLTTIAMKARDDWSGIGGRRLGEDALLFLGRMGQHTSNSGASSTWIDADESVTGIYDGPLAAGSHLVVANESIVAAVPVYGDQIVIGSREMKFNQEQVVPLFRRTPPEISEEVGPIREVLIADADGPASYSMVRDENDALSDHPLDILLNIWTSTGAATWPLTGGGGHTKGSNGDYDWLPRTWGLGIPESRIDIAGIVALRDGEFAGVRAQSFLVGVEGPEKALDVMRRLLQPLLIWPVFTPEGKLSLATAVDPGPGNTAATITAGDIVGPVDTQPWSGFNRYRGTTIECARLWPEDKYGETIRDTDSKGVLRNREPWGKSVLEIDAGYYGDPVTHLLSAATRRTLRRADVRRLLILRNRLPEYPLELRPGIAELAAGEWITLTLGVVIGEDGDRLQVDEHRCMVIEATRRPDDRVQEVRVLDFFPVARANRKVLPCWRIASVSANDEFTIESNEFTTNDAATWIDGAPVNLYDKRGVRRSTDGTSFGSITGTDVVMDSEWTASAVAVTPAVGDLIMPGPYDEAAAYWPNGAWFAGTDETLGTANDDPARWGL